MLSALGQLLPIAVAVAFSSVPITATILILLSPQRNISGAAFLIGWVAGLTLVVSGAAFCAEALPITSLRTQESAFGIAEIVIGGALMVLGIVSGIRAVRRPSTCPGPQVVERGQILRPETVLRTRCHPELPPQGSAARGGGRPRHRRRGGDVGR